MRPFKTSALAFGALLLASGSALAQTELMLWHMEQPPHLVARVQELLDAFNAAHPDIVVKQEPQNWGEIYAKAPAALAAGNGPDMLFAIPDFAPILKEIGAVQDVSAFVKDLDAKHDFVDSAVGSYSYDGGVWAVPLYNMAMSLWYRKSAFEKAGVAVPTTWSEWKAATEKLTADGVHGIGLPANKGLNTDQVVYDFMVNNGCIGTLQRRRQLLLRQPEDGGGLRFPCRHAEVLAARQRGVDVGRRGSVLRQWHLRVHPAVHGDHHLRHPGRWRCGRPRRRADSPCGRPSPVEHHRLCQRGHAALGRRGEAQGLRDLHRLAAGAGDLWPLPQHGAGLFLPVTADGAKAESFWNDPLVQKYKPQVETMIANSANGMLFGFTGGRTFPSIAPISGRTCCRKHCRRW